LENTINQLADERRHVLLSGPLQWGCCGVAIRSAEKAGVDFGVRIASGSKSGRKACAFILTCRFETCQISFMEIVLLTCFEARENPSFVL
jgi:hypothetical protein